MAATTSGRGKDGSAAAVQSGSEGVRVAAVSRYVLDPEKTRVAARVFALVGPRRRGAPLDRRRLRVLVVAQVREQL